MGPFGSERVKDNDPAQEIIEYRTTVPLFGNGPSLAVATYVLRRTVENGEELEPGVKEFVEKTSTWTIV